MTIADQGKLTRRRWFAGGMAACCAAISSTVRAAEPAESKPTWITSETAAAIDRGLAYLALRKMTMVRFKGPAMAEMWACAGWPAWRFSHKAARRDVDHTAGR